MANLTEKDPPVKSGKETLEYRKVLANLVDIVRALKATQEAGESLHLYCVQESWIDPTSSTAPEKVMCTVLVRIEKDVGDYCKFMRILGYISGLDQIKKAIKTTTCKYKKVHCLLCQIPFFKFQWKKPTKTVQEAQLSHAALPLPMIMRSRNARFRLLVGIESH
jgi:hypothetical protein